MKTRKHQCRIQLATSEPVAYRLVYCLFSLFTYKYRCLCYVVFLCVRPYSGATVLHLELFLCLHARLICALHYYLTGLDLVTMIMIDE